MEESIIEPVLQRYATRLKILHDIDRIILASRSPTEIAGAAIKHLKELIPYQRASIALFDFEAGIATTLAVWPESKSSLGVGSRPSLKDFKGLETLKENRPFVEKNLAASSELSETDKSLMDAGIRAYFLLPLQSQGDLIGSFNIGAEHEDDLTLTHMEIAQEVADQVAVAVQQAILFEADQRRLRESEAISKISQALNETLDLEEVFQLIAESAWQIIPAADRTVIHLLDENQVLEPFTVTRNGIVARSDLKMRPGEGIAGHVVMEGELINVADTHTDERFLDSGRSQQRSLIVAPIKNRTAIIGTITVPSVMPHAFTVDDERLLKILGTQAALAIINARLFAAEQRARLVSETLREANAALTKTLDLEVVLETLLAYISRLVPYDSANVMLREGNDRVVISAMRGYSQFVEEPTMLQGLSFETNWPTLKHILEDQRSVIISDTEDDEDWNISIGATHVRSWLSVPLLARGEVIGLYSLDKAEPNFFTEEHRQLAESFAGQAAIAIHNALLYKAEREQFRRLQRSQTQLIQAEKMGALGRLVASIAHEVNNPIQAIQGCLTLTTEEMEEPQPDSDTINMYLGIVKGELNRVATIIQNMRDFYRPAREGMELVDIHSILQSVLQLTSKQMQRSFVTAEMLFIEGLPLIEANPSHLRQVFLNLVLNAIDAMKEGGKLIVETTIPPLSQDQNDLMYVQIIFTDFGQGMTEETRSRLFEPFFTTKDLGSGLGLSISYSIIEAHNGEISVSSELGKGTSFTLRLPVMQP